MYSRIITISYIEKVLKSFDMQECKPGDTQISMGDKFSLRKCPKGNIEIQEMKKILYASTVGSLMYAQICTCLDVHSWGVRKILEQSMNGSLESRHKGYELSKENKRSYAHI